MDAFRKNTKIALNNFKDRYWKRQKYHLRCMGVDGDFEIPNVDSEEIEELIITHGEIKIPLEEFINEYFTLKYKILSDILDKIIPPTATPKILEYAAMNNYDVVFQEGDVVLNERYDPENGEFDEEKFEAMLHK